MADTNTRDQKQNQSDGAAGNNPLEDEPNRTATKAEGDRDIVEQDIKEKEREGKI